MDPPLMFQIEIAIRTEYAEANLGALGEWVGFQRPLVYAREIKYASHGQAALRYPSDQPRQERVLCVNARWRNRYLSV